MTDYWLTGINWAPELLHASIALWAWAMGLLLGREVEARKWRAKADSGTRIVSAGKLYEVTHD